jgi:hypothetical protein
MRWTICTFAITFFGWAGSLLGGTNCVGCKGPTNSVWECEPCATPPGFALEPGCCEEHRHCCDNAWAGYCDHRAKVDACWSQVGNASWGIRLRPCRGTNVCYSCPEKTNSCVDKTNSHQDRPMPSQGRSAPTLAPVPTEPPIAPAPPTLNAPMPPAPKANKSPATVK